MQVIVSFVLCVCMFLVVRYIFIGISCRGHVEKAKTAVSHTNGKVVLKWCVATICRAPVLMAKNVAMITLNLPSKKSLQESQGT